MKDARSTSSGDAGRRAPRYEQALQQLDPPSPSVASMLLRWIARTLRGRRRLRAPPRTAPSAPSPLAEQGDDRNALGHALNVLAAVRWRQGDLDEAERLFHEALQRGTSTTDPRLQVDVMTNLGSLAKIRGDFREALRCYEEALAHGRLHSLLDNILGTLNNLGIANMALAPARRGGGRVHRGAHDRQRARRALDPHPARGQLRRRCRSRRATSPRRSGAATAR